MAVLSLVAACSPDDHTLSAPALSPEDLVEGIAFSITHDSSNPNIVHLTSLLPDSYQIAWMTPQGSSLGKERTLKIAFDGEYEVQMGVSTRGGYVWSNPTSFSINDFCADFVSGELWEYLAGGAGGSKTWVPDNGNYGMKQGFYSCFDPSAVHADMLLKDGTIGNWYADGKTWWEPANGDVGITEDDLKGEMTFSLAGNAGYSVTFTNGISPDQQTGIFNFDPDNMTMSLDGAEIFHALWADDKSEDWSKDLQVLVLTENQLMIANYRSEALSGEDRCIYCWNFVSKEYADSYVPGDVPDPEPVLPDGWKDDISQTVITSVKWVLSDQNPLDWCQLDGTLMNGWNSPADYPDWLGTPDTSVYGDFSMTLDSKDNSAVFAYPDGTSVSTTYELDDKGIYTFADNVPATSVIGWASFELDANNGLRIMRIEKDPFGDVSGMWLGKRDPEKPEYLAYHFVPTAGSNGGETNKGYVATLNFNNTSDWTMVTGPQVIVKDEGTYTASIDVTWTAGDPMLWLDVNPLLKDHPNADVILKDIKIDGSSISFDDSAVSRCIGDDPTIYRRYICNPWGLASCFPSFDVFHPQSNAEVTFEVVYDTGASTIE